MQHDHSNLEGARRRFAEAAAEVDGILIEQDQHDAIEHMNASGRAQGADSERASLDIGDNIQRESDERPTKKRRRTDDDAQTTTEARHEAYHKNLQEASEEVIVEKTRKEYKAIWNAFGDWLQEVGYIKSKSELDEFARKKEISPDFPKWIATFLMDGGDPNDIVTGLPKPNDVPIVKYGTIAKWRSAISNKFKGEYGCGDRLWMENPLKPGTYVGNPCLSPVVSQYMVSLKRRQARLGLDVTSAQAMTEGLIRRAKEYLDTLNRLEEIVAGTQSNPNDWGGWRTRVMLHCIFTISMLCLLRFGEALGLMWEDIKPETDEHGNMLHRSISIAILRGRGCALLLPSTTGILLPASADSKCQGFGKDVTGIIPPLLSKHPL
ncbi:hypothetical protein EIP91_010175 [Steccherinum ochraceum]|uniref:Uncharacterized protein n=1 Tax=Steccherinum ochraceum TaxID=92696 RepID=A0A4R0RZG7_9APHY|nr:hypothetical protein EIP91_010175 [Steccherinum ochraceum]